MAVVEDREGVGVAALDQGHQVLVGEELQGLAVSSFLAMVWTAIVPCSG